MRKLCCYCKIDSIKLIECYVDKWNNRKFANVKYLYFNHIK